MLILSVNLLDFVLDWVLLKYWQLIHSRSFIEILRTKSVVVLLNIFRKAIGCRIAKYLSMLIAVIVNTLAPTETPEIKNKYYLKFWNYFCTSTDNLEINRSILLIFIILILNTE
jgi:hypothetical protein